MRKGLLALYEWLAPRGKVRALLLSVLLILLGVSTWNLEIDGDLGQFLQHKEKAHAEVFEHLPIQDRILLMVRMRDGAPPNIDRLVTAADSLVSALEELDTARYFSRIDGPLMEDDLWQHAHPVYAQLPCFFTPALYDSLALLLQDTSFIRAHLSRCRQQLMFPFVEGIEEVLLRDPLGLGWAPLQQMTQGNDTSRFTLKEGYLYEMHTGTILLFAQPARGMNHLAGSKDIIKALEIITQRVESAWPTVEVLSFGGSIVSGYNTQQVERDTLLTVTLALVLIVGLMWLLYRSIHHMVWLLIPVLFGALFAVGVASLLQGSISLMAVGTSAVVVGITLSYSMHVVTHAHYVKNGKELLFDLAEPLTVGSFTTMGAFVALLFARTPLLHDFGLLSSLWLVGTTLFCLIFLPHYVRYAPSSPPEMGANTTKRGSSLLLRIENALGSMNHRPHIGWVIALLTLGVVSLFFFSRVQFSSQMEEWNYQPAHVTHAEQWAEKLSGSTEGQLFVVVSDSTMEGAISGYHTLHTQLASLQQEGLLQNYWGVEPFLFTPEEQAHHIASWNTFWQENERGDSVVQALTHTALAMGFTPETIPLLTYLWQYPFAPLAYDKESLFTGTLLADWVYYNASLHQWHLMSRIEIAPAQKKALYHQLESLPGVTIIDRGYYLEEIVQAIQRDFHFLLSVCSALVFLSLWVAYGRLELTLLAFLPMAMSWVIILGLMALLGLRFNIVNVILSTLIFGMGDDFSIFVMDGLLRHYRDGSKVLGKHKTAIVLSATTTFIGIGVLIFAKHPAIRSIALTASLGILLVVVVAFVLIPFLFHFLVTHYTQFGRRPHTLGSIAMLIITLLFICVSTVIFVLYAGILFLLPVRTTWKRTQKNRFVHGFMEKILRLLPIQVTQSACLKKQPLHKNFIFIANHQSYLDVPLIVGSLTPVVIITNQRIAHSPVGWVTRILHYPHTGQGYEQLQKQVRSLMVKGYNVVIFPEGTRSRDGRIRRFHQGAFYLAQELGLGIYPLVIWGTRHVLAKGHPSRICRGHVCLDCGELEPLSEETPAEQSKRWRQWYEERMAHLHAMYSTPSDPYYSSLIKSNYLYKGSELVRHVKRELTLHHHYATWHALLPLEGKIMIMGCEYGALVFLLSQLGRERHIVGIDHEKECIAVAQHSFLANGHTVFHCGDWDTWSMLDTSVVQGIVLRVRAWKGRDFVSLLHSCFTRLTTGGILLVEESMESFSLKDSTLKHTLQSEGQQYGFTYEPPQETTSEGSVLHVLRCIEGAENKLS